MSEVTKEMELTKLTNKELSDKIVDFVTNMKTRKSKYITVYEADLFKEMLNRNISAYFKFTIEKILETYKTIDVTDNVINVDFKNKKIMKDEVKE